MLDRNWHKGCHRPEDHRRGDDDDHPERHSGWPQRHHHGFHRDDGELHMRDRGGRNYRSDDEDRDAPPGSRLKHAYDDGGDQGDGPDRFMPHEGENLGWDAAAWDDAGGFEAVLLGHLSGSLGPAGGAQPILVIAIEDLDVEFNTLMQITQVQNTLVFLGASNGGAIAIGGDVNANGLQLASIEQSGGAAELQDPA